MLKSVSALPSFSPKYSNRLASSFCKSANSRLSFSTWGSAVLMNDDRASCNASPGSVDVTSEVVLVEASDLRRPSIDVVNSGKETEISSFSMALTPCGSL